MESGIRHRNAPKGALAPAAHHGSSSAPSSARTGGLSFSRQGDNSSQHLGSPSRRTPQHQPPESIHRNLCRKVEGPVVRRTLGTFSAVIFVLGTIIGSGIYVVPSQVMVRVQSVGMCLVVWGVSGVVATLAALSYCELGTRIPRSGGELNYLMQAFGGRTSVPGTLLSFMFAWMTAFALKPLAQAIICLTVAEYTLVPFLEDVDQRWLKGFYYASAVKLLAIDYILLLCFINCVSAQLAGRLQVLLTLMKAGCVSFIISGGILRMSQGYVSELLSGFEKSPRSKVMVTPVDVTSAFYGCLFAYEGWNSLNFIAEELKVPQKTMPRAIMIAMPLITAIYMMMNISYVTVLERHELVASQSVAWDFAKEVLTSKYFVVPVMIAISALSSANGLGFASGRLSYAASREGQLTHILSNISFNKQPTPRMGVIFNAICAIVFVLLSNAGILIEIFSFCTWIFYTLSMAALLIFRFMGANVNSHYKVFLPIPVTVLLISMYMAVAPILFFPRIGYLYVVGFTLVGLVYYIPFVYMRKNIFGRNHILTKILRYIFNVVPEKGT